MLQMNFFELLEVPKASLLLLDESRSECLKSERMMCAGKRAEMGNQQRSS